MIFYTKHITTFFLLLFCSTTALSVTIEQKVGQLLVIGIPETQMNHRLTSHISAIKPGGVILFKRNIKSIEQIIQLNKSLHRASSFYSASPLLVMTDQEGGAVTRIQFKNKSIPSASELGLLNNFNLTTTIGYFTGALLSTLGFNMNLAPVVDLSKSKRTFIGSRSFGNNPNLVFHHATAFAKGMKKYNVLSTLKHFPGHGNTRIDSHLKMPTKSQPLDQLLKSDLSPFVLASKSKFPYVIMSSHIYLSKLEEKRLPATFSKNIITELLIKKFKFKGLVITDDLLMRGTNINAIGKKAELSLIAGNHLLMIAWSPKKQYEAFRYLVNKAKTDKNFLEVINKRYKHVIAFKNKHLTKDSFWKKPTGDQIKKIGFIENRLDYVLNKIKEYKSHKQAINY